MAAPFALDQSRHSRCKSHVRFAPNSDRESGFPQTVMSSLSPKADMCGARSNVCFGPQTDIAALSKIPRSAASSIGSDSPRVIYYALAFFVMTLLSMMWVVEHVSPCLI
jgi:hypothetical protein